MQEMCVWSLSQDDPLKKEMVTHSNILPGKSHGQRSLAGFSPWGRRESDTTSLLNNDCCYCCCQVASVVSDSVQPRRWQPTRIPGPWDSPGKNTGVGCHFLLPHVEIEVAQTCLTLRNPMDCSLPGSSVHGIFQATVLEWGAITFSETTTGDFQMYYQSEKFQWNIFTHNFNIGLYCNWWTSLKLCVMAFSIIFIHGLSSFVFSLRLTLLFINIYTTKKYILGMKNCTQPSYFKYTV